VPTGTSSNTLQVHLLEGWLPRGDDRLRQSSGL
jgi:hypothetical protein